MASAKILRQLIRAGASGDVVAFKHVSESIIQEERQKQYHLTRGADRGARIGFKAGGALATVVRWQRKRCLILDEGATLEVMC